MDANIPACTKMARLNAFIFDTKIDAETEPAERQLCQMELGIGADKWQAIVGAVSIVSFLAATSRAASYRIVLAIYAWGYRQTCGSQKVARPFPGAN